MSAFGDAFSAVRQVILLDDRVSRTQEDIARIRIDVDDLKHRVARLEGLMEMAMHRDSRRRLDRD